MINTVGQQQWPVLDNPAAAITALIEVLKIDFQLGLDSGIHELPGPTGETNRLSINPRGLILCLGPSKNAALSQALSALAQGNSVVIVAPGINQALREFNKRQLPVVAIEGQLTPQVLSQVNGYNAVLSQAETTLLKQYRQALADREGVLLPLITETDAPERLVIERHLCIDTTAAGGNASLIAAGS